MDIKLPDDQLIIYQPQEQTEFKNILLKNNMPIVKFDHGKDDRGRIPYYNYQVPNDYFDGQPVVGLFRDPRDTIVSYYHQIMSKKKINISDDTTLEEFIRSELHGIRFLIASYNQWAMVIKRTNKGKLYFYEDLRLRPKKLFRDILYFWGFDTVSHECLDYAIQVSSFDNMRRHEINIRSQLNLQTEDHFLRVRKGLIGGYVHELGQSDVDYLNKVIKEHLSPLFSRYLCQPSIDPR